MKQRFIALEQQPIANMQRPNCACSITQKKLLLKTHAFINYLMH